MQLLAQATYALTPTQRARLCRYGSRPPLVIAEAPLEGPARADLYLLLHRPPPKGQHVTILETAIALSQALLQEPAITTVVRRVRWLRLDETQTGLAISMLDAPGAPLN